MFGLWFSIFGLLFGGISSFEAKRKGRSQSDWFVMGFLFSIPAIIVLRLLPNEQTTENEEQINLGIERKIPFSTPTYS